MRRELLIKNATGGWDRLDLGEDYPTLNFQVNDLANLSDRQSTYSQALKLPASPNNCRLFGFANVFEARSAAPYVTRLCCYYEDGMQILGPNYNIELRSVTIEPTGSTFTCQIVSAGRSLFDTLKGLPMSDLTLDPIPWTFENVQAAAAGSTTHKYLIGVDTSEGQQESEIFWPGKGFPQGALQYYYPLFQFRPYIPILYVIRQLLLVQGFTLDTDIEGIAGYESLYLSLSELKPRPDSNAPHRATISSVPYTSTGAITNPVAVLQNYGTGTGTFNFREIIGAMTRPSIDGNQKGIDTGMAYCAISAMSVRFALTVMSSGDGDTSRVQYRIRRFNLKSMMPVTDPSSGYSYADYEDEIIIDTRSDDGTTDYLVSTPARDNTFTTEAISLAPGEMIMVEANLLSIGPSGRTYTATLETLIDDEDNNVLPGGLIYPQDCTGFKTQYDLLQAFIQLYGLTVELQQESNTFRAYAFNGISSAQAIAQSEDWTDKIDMATPRETSFILSNYAQQNRVLFAESNAQPAIEQQTGVITVANPNLTETRDMFTLPFESAKDVTLLSPADRYTRQLFERDTAYSISDSTQVRRYLKQPVGYSKLGWYAPEFSRETGKPHLVRMLPLSSDSPVPVSQITITYLPADFLQGSYAGGYINATLPKRVTVDLQEHVDRFFGTLEQRVLSRVRVIEADFNLTPEDIQNLDLFRPVYIEAYGDYFYISKISNFGANALTKCTLICLNM